MIEVSDRVIAIKGSPGFISGAVGVVQSIRLDTRNPKRSRVEVLPRGKIFPVVVLATHLRPLADITQVSMGEFHIKIKEDSTESEREKEEAKLWQQPSHILFLCSDDRVKVLGHEGMHADHWFRELGQSDEPECGFDPPVGLSVLTGKIKTMTYDTIDGREYDSVFEGTYRPLTGREVEALLTTGAIF